jgi:hypothetical protein
MFKTFIEKNFLLLIGFTAGLFSIYFFGDRSLDNEWNDMVNILEKEKILSSRIIDGEAVPNIFMPPLYPLFLFILKKFFFNIDFYVNGILLTQLFIFILSAVFLEKILDHLFEKKYSKLGVLIFVLFPLNVYSISQISSINLQVFLLFGFIYNFIKIYKTSQKKNIFLFSLCAGLLILLRGEFFIFFILSVFYLFFKKKSFLTLFLTFFLTTIIISPYLIRNYKMFGEIILTKSTGFNLLKGNNPLSKVEGVPMWLGYDAIPDLEVQLKNLPTSKYDLLSDKIFLDRAIDYIKSDPERYIKLYFKKVLSFLIIDIDSTYPNYYSLFNVIPKIFLSITSLMSIIVLFRLKISLYNYFVLYYFLSAGLYSIFFILPRYSLSILPIQIILTLFLLRKILNSLKT